MTPERYRRLNEKPVRQGKYVLYRMQASVRTDLSLTLCYAVEEANRLELPLKVVFRLDGDFPEANYRHFVFLTTRLEEVGNELEAMGISFHIGTGPFDALYEPWLADAACVVTDRGYLRIQREWSAKLAALAPCAVTEVEDNLVVPVESASSKREWAARTLRPRVMGKVDYFMEDADTICAPLRCQLAVQESVREQNRRVVRDVLERLERSRYLAPGSLRGDGATLNTLMDRFVNDKLATYDADRNDPSLAGTSRLSAFLHFGMISPLAIMKRVAHHPLAAPFIEQLVVRRELAHNFIYYTPDYDTFGALPAWAVNTLGAHRGDERPYRYDGRRLEEAQTHDPCWNAAMREMVRTGYMENTMRMYWGKKVMEWSASPEEAFEWLLRANNRYFLDGRDANSYTGVAWCFGLHDRPWQERPVFGTVRYMNEQGLRRKYDMEEYIRHFF